jgi:hypothetical protein
MGNRTTTTATATTATATGTKGGIPVRAVVAIGYWVVDLCRCCRFQGYNAEYNRYSDADARHSSMYDPVDHPERVHLADLFSERVLLA